MSFETYEPSPEVNPDTQVASFGTTIREPFLVYFGDVAHLGYAKTGLGLIEWRREKCIGQLRLPGCTVDGGLKDMSIDQAVFAGARSIVVGVAPVGGSIPVAWEKDLVEAAEAGLDVVSGLHSRLADIPPLVDVAARSGSRLFDIRIPPTNLPIGTGRKRTGRRLLTVGSDCAVGKKYTALAIEKEMRARGWNAQFRATGQTGILIAGGGIPMDSVVSDFLSGAAELVSPNAEEDHWDVIEGQGSLSHPSYAGVSLGLLHGSQPDAMVLCHDASRTEVLALGGSEDGFPLLPFDELISMHLLMAKRVNPNARFVGVSLNTSHSPVSERAAIKTRWMDETGLPVIDPITDGAGLIVDNIQDLYGSGQ